MKNILFSHVPAFFLAVSMPLFAQEGDNLSLLKNSLNHGGLTGLQADLAGKTAWPTIMSDFRARREGVDETRQRDLVALAEQVMQQLRVNASAPPPDDEDGLNKEITLLYSLGERFWKSGGYRNYVLALVCGELAGYRCGKIVLLTNGKHTGPRLPEVFDYKTSQQMLEFFRSVIPESEELMKMGLLEQLAAHPPQEKSWILMTREMAKNVKFTPGTEGHNTSTPFFSMGRLSNTLNSVDLGTLMTNLCRPKIVRNSMVEALAWYLAQGGDIRVLLTEPTNATKYRAVMKEATFRFRATPLYPETSFESPAWLAEKMKEPPAEFAKSLFSTKPVNDPEADNHGLSPLRPK
ncbi:MAG: hypothetical protein V4733_12340 [Verrucomicrobiota bacterium]